MLKLGLRDGEVQHGEWASIGWVSSTFHVHRSRNMIGGSRITRTESSRSSDLLTELRDWREAHPNDVLIIPTRNGRPNGKLLLMLKRLARAAGLECGKCKDCVEKATAEKGCDDYYLHKFRATFITMLFRSGRFDPPTIMRCAGHEDLATTMKYAQSVEAHEKVAAISEIAWEAETSW